MAGVSDLIEPDSKDWTWVLQDRCPECGLVAASVDRAELPHLLRENARAWLALLAQPDATTRHRLDRWSTLEYACHVHDVHQLFHERVTSMLEQDEPTFANWDQDQTAAESRYADQLPSVIGPALVASAYAVADLYASVPDDAWGRRGVRSDGSEFTVESFGRYHLHDVHHHLWDVDHGVVAPSERG